MRSVTPMPPLDIEQVEHVRALQAVVERRQHQAGAQQRLAPGRRYWSNRSRCRRVQLGRRHVDLSERVLRLLDFVAVPHVAVLHARRPLEVVDVVDVLQRHRESLDPVGQLDRDRRQVDAAGLLEVGELGDLLAVEQHLPADAPGAERRRLPVVFLEAHVVGAQVDAAGLETLQISCCTSSGAGFRITWNCWCLNRRFGFSPKRPSAGRRDGCT